MARVIVAIATVVAGLVAQVRLLNVTLFWLWAAGFLGHQHPRAIWNAVLCSAPCFQIFMAQAAAVWFLGAQPPGAAPAQSSHRLLHAVRV